MSNNQATTTTKPTSTMDSIKNSIKSTSSKIQESASKFAKDHEEQINGAKKRFSATKEKIEESKLGSKIKASTVKFADDHEEQIGKLQKQFSEAKLKVTESVTNALATSEDGKESPNEEKVENDGNEKNNNSSEESADDNHEDPAEVIKGDTDKGIDVNRNDDASLIPKEDKDEFYDSIQKPPSKEFDESEKPKEKEEDFDEEKPTDDNVTEDATLSTSNVVNLGKDDDAGSDASEKDTTKMNRIEPKLSADPSEKKDDTKLNEEEMKKKKKRKTTDKMKEAVNAKLLIVKSNLKKFMKEYKEKKNKQNKEEDSTPTKSNEGGNEDASHTTDTSGQDDVIVNAANFVVTAETNSKNFLLNARDKLKKAVSSKKLDNESNTTVDSKKNKVDAAAVESEQQEPSPKSPDNAMIVPTNQQMVTVN